jgi:hypothetical protein
VYAGRGSAGCGTFAIRMTSGSSASSSTDLPGPAEPVKASPPSGPTRTPLKKETLGGRSRGASPCLAAARMNSSRPDGLGPWGAEPPYLARFAAAVEVPHRASWCPESSATMVASTRPSPESNGCPAPR